MLSVTNMQTHGVSGWGQPPPPPPSYFLTVRSFSPCSCEVGPISHHASTQFLLLWGVIESLLQRQAEDKLDFVAMDHAHPLGPGQIGGAVIKEVKVNPSFRSKEDKNMWSSEAALLLSYHSKKPGQRIIDCKYKSWWSHPGCEQEAIFQVQLQLFCWENILFKDWKTTTPVLILN